MHFRCGVFSLTRNEVVLTYMLDPKVFDQFSPPVAAILETLLHVSTTMGLTI